jgi:RsmE family RNA methyltransferase
MNLVLLTEEDFVDADTVRLTGRRRLHAREVLKAQAGDALKVGLLQGPVGVGTVQEDSPDALVLKVSWRAAPPPRPGVDLILALPRPKTLKKVLPACAALGVDRLVLLNSARVEKSYFESFVLEETSLRELLFLGLEQAKDTVLPEISIKKFFRPFVEDEIGAFCGPVATRLLPHPPAAKTLAEGRGPPGRKVLAIGPEGGWVPFEVALLEAQGFVPVTAGPRPLRVEVAIPWLLGMLGA